MEDLISKKELYNQIRLYLDKNFVGETSARTELSVGEIASIISDMDTISFVPEEWIPCSEIIPEIKDESVLVCFDNGNIETVHVEDFFSDITAGRDENGNLKYTKWYLHHKPQIISWMPLPNPYKQNFIK